MQPSAQVIDIMAALKESMQAKGRAKVKDAVRRKMGKEAPKETVRASAKPVRPGSRRTAH